MTLKRNKKDPTVEKLIKRRAWIKIIGNDYILNDQEKNEIQKVLNIVYKNDNYIKIVANFIKYNLTNFKHRLDKLIQFKTLNNLETFYLRYGDTEGNKR